MECTHSLMRESCPRVPTTSVGIEGGNLNMVSFTQMLARDTSAGAEDLQIELHRRLTPSNRLAMAIEMSEFARQLSRIGLHAGIRNLPKRSWIGKCCSSFTALLSDGSERSRPSQTYSFCHDGSGSTVHADGFLCQFHA